MCRTGSGRHDVRANGGFSGSLWPSAPLRDLDANPRPMPSCRSGGSTRSCCGAGPSRHASASTLRIRDASSCLCAATIRATSGGEEVQNHEEALQGSKVGLSATDHQRRRTYFFAIFMTFVMAAGFIAYKCYNELKRETKQQQTLLPNFSTASDKSPTQAESD